MYCPICSPLQQVDGDTAHPALLTPGQVDGDTALLPPGQVDGDTVHPALLTPGQADEDTDHPALLTPGQVDGDTAHPALLSPGQVDGLLLSMFLADIRDHVATQAKWLSSIQLSYFTDDLWNTLAIPACMGEQTGQMSRSGVWSN